MDSVASAWEDLSTVMFVHPCLNGLLFFTKNAQHLQQEESLFLTEHPVG